VLTAAKFQIKFRGLCVNFAEIKDLLSKCFGGLHVEKENISKEIFEKVSSLDGTKANS